MENIKRHTHNGQDSEQIDPVDLLGFPVYSSVPTHEANNGTVVLYFDGATTYKIYVRINNSWKSSTLS